MAKTKNSYSIHEVAKLLGLATSTIRYYDKEGLLPFVERKESGYRVFTEKDLATLKVIDCLKKTGMPLKEIKQFSAALRLGDSTLEERYAMFKERKEAVLEQISKLQEVLKIIEYKCWYYQTAIEAGTEKIHTQEKPFADDSCLDFLKEEK